MLVSRFAVGRLLAAPDNNNCRSMHGLYWGASAAAEDAALSWGGGTPSNREWACSFPKSSSGRIYSPSLSWQIQAICHVSAWHPEPSSQVPAGTSVVSCTKDLQGISSRPLFKKQIKLFLPNETGLIICDVTWCDDFVYGLSVVKVALFVFVDLLSSL